MRGDPNKVRYFCVAYIYPTPERNTPMIYTLTAVRDKEPRRTRCWGYELSEEKARSLALKANDIFFESGYYTHLVIESVEPGPWVFPQVVAWYRAEFVLETHEYKISECSCPEVWVNVVSFGMG